MNTYLAIDFGAGSGRVMAGSIAQGILRLEEIHRFPNRQVQMGNHVYWDFLSLFAEMKHGIGMAARKGYAIKGIGIDTWGVDFGLIDRNGQLLGNPVCYRDNRTAGLPDEVFTADELRSHYAEAGIQVMNINTLYQLYSLKKSHDPQLEIADRLLFMPDLFCYFLTGVARNEYCIASTSELLDACRRDWNRKLIDRLGFPQHLFGPIVQPGTIWGKLKKDIRDETGLKDEVDVIAVGSHDTASAVFAVPRSENRRRAYLSSGTWSLLGIEADQPILNEKARAAGFTNEGGVGGKIRFLQNITGLWMLQRLRLQWETQGKPTGYDYLTDAAGKSGLDTVINVDDPTFQNPADMEAAITVYCADRHLPIPVTQGDFVRCVLLSLANRYKQGINQLNSLIPDPVNELCIVGGGSQNSLLNELTSEALGIKVNAGPVEATAIGNILVQALAKGEIKSRDDLKNIIQV